MSINEEYMGPFSVASMDRYTEIVRFFEQDYTMPRPLSVAQVEKYLSPYSLSTSCFGQQKSSLKNFTTPPIEYDIFMTNIIQSKDLNSNTLQILNENREGVQNLMNRGNI